MKKKNEESSERGYRVVQIEGKITWGIEELWDGGVVRGPFGSREAAIQREEKIARAEGFIDDLVLKEVVGEEKSLHDSFEKDSDGNWHCTKGVSINIEGRNIVIAKGMTFTRGTLFMLVDVGQWLDENYS
jgi:hypothetical protein